MAPWLLSLGASMAEAQQRKEAEGEARKRAGASISADRARQLGYPAYGVQAAEFNRDMSQANEGQNMLAALLPLLAKKGGR